MTDLDTSGSDIDEHLSKLARECVDGINDGWLMCERNGLKTTIPLMATVPVSMAVWRAFMLGKDARDD